MRDNDTFEINGIRVQRGTHQGHRYSIKYVPSQFGDWLWFVTGVGGGFAATQAAAEAEAVDEIEAWVLAHKRVG